MLKDDTRIRFCRAREMLRATDGSALRIEDPPRPARRIVSIELTPGPDIASA